MSYRFLPYTDLGEGAIQVAVHVDPACFLGRAQGHVLWILYDHEAIQGL